MRQQRKMRVRMRFTLYFLGVKEFPFCVQSSKRFLNIYLPKVLVLPYLGVQIKIVTKQLKTCINKFYGCINLKVNFI